MEQLNNVQITKVFEGKSGEGKFGFWQAYNFYIDDPDWKDIKFSYFGGGKKTTPTEGMNLSLLEFEVSHKGEYTNYDVGKIIPITSKPKPVPTNSPAQGSNNKTWPEKDNKKFIDHGRCMIELMKMATINPEGGDQIDKDYLKDLLDIFKRGCEYMVAPIGKAKKPEPKKEPEPDRFEKGNYEPEYEGPPEIEDDQIPF